MRTHDKARRECGIHILRDFKGSCARRSKAPLFRVTDPLYLSQSMTEVKVKKVCPKCGNEIAPCCVTSPRGDCCNPSVPRRGVRLPSAALAIALVVTASLGAILVGCKQEPPSSSSANGSSPFGAASSAPANPGSEVQVFDVHSPDGQRRVQVNRHEGRYFYVVDGRRSGDYEDIGLDPPVFSADGKHLAYVIHRGAKLAVVLDGREMPLFVDIASANQFLRSGNVGYIGPDPGLNAEAVKHVGLVFSPNGERLAYYAWTGEDEMAVVVNDKPGPVFHKIGIASILFSTDSKHLAYIGEKGGAWYVVVDDQLSQGFDAIGWGSLRFGADGPEITFRAQKRGTWSTVQFRGR